MPACNERFGATAAVTPQKVPCEYERKHPAERLVPAPPAPSRFLVMCNAGESGVEKDVQT